MGPRYGRLCPLSTSKCTVPPVRPETVILAAKSDKVSVPAETQAFVSNPVVRNGRIYGLCVRKFVPKPRLGPADAVPRMSEPYPNK